MCDGEALGATTAGSDEAPEAGQGERAWSWDDVGVAGVGGVGREVTEDAAWADEVTAACSLNVGQAERTFLVRCKDATRSEKGGEGGTSGVSEAVWGGELERVGAQDADKGARLGRAGDAVACGMDAVRRPATLTFLSRAALSPTNRIAVLQRQHRASGGLARFQVAVRLLNIF